MSTSYCVAASMAVSLSWLDWSVIGVYVLGMLAIGWYCSRRTATTEDYLLGGRRMGALSVGLSLFAALLSSITYLSIPGEIIKYGPMILIGTLSAALPAVWIIGWLVIPRIMKVKVVSAYEILGTGLGPLAYLLGSSLYLITRVLWMAVIMYATVDKVLLPLMGLSTSSFLYVATVLGVITIAYTATGGLRAVVLTGVVQTAILFLGAILTLVVISNQFGGVSGWWPREWPIHWPAPDWGFTPGVRMSFMGILTATFATWMCLFGSDQIAIQRYLSTRDVAAARRSLIYSIVSATLINVLLAAVGLALLAWFVSRTSAAAATSAMFADADQFFARFISEKMPQGLKGLMLAAILAAAMSSLSSGINSCCAIATNDLIDRFRRKKHTELDHVQLARYLSLVLGIVVVVLSAFVGMVKGNLYAASVKVIGLPIGVIFGLFFTAMFVRRATSFGALVGAFFGMSVLVVVSFWEEITGNTAVSFIWGLPLGILVQIAVGMLASLMPIGRKPTSLPISR